MLAKLNTFALVGVDAEPAKGEWLFLPRFLIRLQYDSISVRPFAFARSAKVTTAHRSAANVSRDSCLSGLGRRRYCPFACSIIDGRYRRLDHALHLVASLLEQEKRIQLVGRRCVYIARKWVYGHHSILLHRPRRPSMAPGSTQSVNRHWRGELFYLEFPRRMTNPWNARMNALLSRE
jgi:hypothetical protein